MNKVKMLTVVPTTLAVQLMQKKRITDYNTLPQINKDVMRVIKEIMAQRVGYENLPMACLSGIPNSTEVSGESVLSVLPMNSRNSVIFQLEMPEDMILSISFSTLLDISNQANEINDPQSSVFDFLCQDLEDAMVLGFDSSLDDPVSFVPFLALDKCKCLVQITDEIKDEDLHMDAVTEVSLRALTSFNGGN